MLLITAEAAVLLTDFRYQLWAQQEATDFEVVHLQGGPGGNPGGAPQGPQGAAPGF